MNFDLTPDQEQLQALVRDFAEGEVAPIAEKLDRDGGAVCTPSPWVMISSLCGSG